jgi:hypothetical protein
MMCTIYENIYSNDPHYITVDAALDRIKTGKSQKRIEEIRLTLDKKKADLLKRDLPSICFSGKFTERKDSCLTEHSGYLVLDFDEVNVDVLAVDILRHNFIYALWLSPRGNGLKALVKIADGSKHREHFAALQDVFKDVDRSGVNPSRVCYESYDPSITIKTDAVAFTKTKTVERIETTEAVREDENIFRNILKWLSNRNDAFVSGERNLFVFKLACALCRFGVWEDTAIAMILREFPTSNDFTDKEGRKAIKSAYRKNKDKFGSAFFERETLYDKVTMKEVKIEIDDEAARLRDVVYGQDVKEQAFKIYENGYEFVVPIGIPQLDRLFKMRRSEITLLTGIGNYGKSMFKKWFQVLRAVALDEKFASFPPEDYPVHNYYHELTEILLGCDCTPNNPGCPVRAEYNAAYDFISKHFFYIAPTDLSPTPEYIKQRFLELIIKEKIDGVDIDPFNQMTNDYRGSNYRDDKYLEGVLADFLRFAQQNNIYFLVIAHPAKMTKGKDGNYPCPDVFDLAGGAMWSNKMSNILVYHRPFMQTDPANPLVEFHTKKIKDQKTVGHRGFILFDLNRKTRRFEFDQVDYLELALERRKLYFGLSERVAVNF